MTYLDTHVLVWLYALGGPGLSDRASILIEESESLLISPIVLLELKYLYEIERIAVDPHKIYQYLKNTIGLNTCNKPFLEIVKEAFNQDWTRDPFDRIITAHAAIEKDILITKDTTIKKHYQYAEW